MRTIKFRGKRVDKNEFVFGDLLTGMGYKKGKFFILPLLTHYPYDCHSLDGYEVLPDTVGQFTGLYDKNGKEIYEGDIVDAWSAGGHLPNGIIKWGEGIAGFFIMPPKCNAVWHLVGDNENKETLEIVGNIHDNPELLKGNNV